MRCLLLWVGYSMADEALETLFRRHGTDKQASAHAYVHAYSMLLGPWRKHVRSLLEVGIGSVNRSYSANMAGLLRRGYQPGASLRSWREYLPNARVVGLDVDASTARAAANPQLRIETFSADTTNAAAVAKLLINLTDSGARLFDVVIDDGLHTWQGQQATLVHLWPLVRPGGAYFIEDVVWGDLTKNAVPGGSNPLLSQTSASALEILREGGAHAISLDAFWSTLSKHRFSTIVALQKPEISWPLLYDDNKGLRRTHRRDRPASSTNPFGLLGRGMCPCDAADTSNAPRHCELQALLTEHGNATANAADSLGCSPLSLASAVGNVPGVQALLASGADTHHHDTLGLTPLHHAASCARCNQSILTTLVALLLEAGADPSAVDRRGRAVSHDKYARGRGWLSHGLLGARGSDLRPVARQARAAARRRPPCPPAGHATGLLWPPIPSPATPWPSQCLGEPLGEP